VEVRHLVPKHLDVVFCDDEEKDLIRVYFKETPIPQKSVLPYNTCFDLPENRLGIKTICVMDKMSDTFYEHGIQVRNTNILAEIYRAVFETKEGAFWGILTVVFLGGRSFMNFMYDAVYRTKSRYLAVITHPFHSFAYASGDSYDCFISKGIEEVLLSPVKIVLFEHQEFKNSYVHKSGDRK